MAADEHELDELLARIDAAVDPEHLHQVDARYRRALTWQTVDRPPLVIQSAFAKHWVLPAPWDRFQTYPHRQVFTDPAAMMQNQLLDYVVPGLLLHDDNPLAIRNDHGTIQIASALGARWHQHADDPPWVEALHDESSIRALIERGEFAAQRGVAPRTIQTLTFYHEKLAGHRRAEAAIQVAMPDLQGPMDTAEQLWGGEVLLALLEQPELARALMACIVKAMLAAIQCYRPLTREWRGEESTTQHGYQIPGQLLIRNDSSILVSPQTYAEVIRPFDEQVLQAVGGGSIHFCGNGTHLVEPMLHLDALHGLDLGQSAMVDLPAVYAACRPRRVAITHIMPARAELISGEAARRYPTGVVFVYETQDLDDARAVLAGYRAAGTGASHTAGVR